MSTTVWASVAAIGFGFVTYYFFLSGEKEKKREKAPRSTSVASIEIESIARTKSLASLAKESVTVSKVAKEVSSEQKVKVSVEKNTQTKTLVHAELNSTKKSVVSVIYEQESVYVSIFFFFFFLPSFVRLQERGKAERSCQCGRRAGA
jgi:ABC-type bacteriocin/lantibiotic exporter with double-glycine peptidase domain